MQHQEFSNWLIDPSASPFPAGIVAPRVSGTMKKKKKDKKGKKAVPLNASSSSSLVAPPLAPTSAPPAVLPAPTVVRNPSLLRGATASSSSSASTAAPAHAAPAPPAGKPMAPLRAPPVPPPPPAPQGDDESSSADDSTDSLERVNNLPSLPTPDEGERSVTPPPPPEPVKPKTTPNRGSPVKRRFDTNDHMGGAPVAINLNDAFSDRPTAPPEPPTGAAALAPFVTEDASMSFVVHNTLDYASVMADGFFDIVVPCKPIPQRLAELTSAHRAVMLDGERDAALRRTQRDIAKMCRLTHDTTVRVRLVALGVVAAARDTEHETSNGGGEPAPPHCQLVGDVRPAGVRERALTFKYVADRVPIANKLVRDGARYWNVIVVNKSEWIVDLVHRPGAVHALDGPDGAAYVASLLDVRVNPFLNAANDFDSSMVGDSSTGGGAGAAGAASGSQSLRQRTMEQVNLNEEIEMLCKLGSGSFGEVWRAAISGYTCAVKILRTSTMTLKEQTRVVSEVALLQELDHANIVRYLGREIRSNDDLLIIMEYVPHSLYDAVRRARRGLRRRFAPREIMNVTANIARGLFYLHNLRVPVIHRDLKSKNVLVEWDIDSEVISITKLCDFGVAKAMTESTVADSLVGTTRWMAPEIVSLLYGGKAVAYTIKADIWSLGMVLYEMIECQVPYQEVNQWDVKGFITRGVVPRITNTDPGIAPLIQLLNSCLQLNPRNRPTARDFMATVLM